MTFEHFYSILKPHKAASFNTVERAKKTIVCIVIFCILYNIPHLFTSSDFGRQCMSHVNSATNIYIKIYFWSWICVGYIIPFILLISMNSVIIHTLRKRSSNMLVTENPDQGQGNSEGHESRQPEKQIYVMLLLVSFTFIILYTPANVLVLHMNFFTGNTPTFFAGQYLFLQISEKLFYTSHGINFFLYVLSGQKFRTDLIKLFRKERIKWYAFHDIWWPKSETRTIVWLRAGGRWGMITARVSNDFGLHHCGYFFAIIPNRTNDYVLHF